MSMKAGQIDKGTALLVKGQPYIVVEREFVNPGKGSAFVRLKMKSPTTGQTLSDTIKSQDTVEDINVEDRDCQYLYQDGELFHFQDANTNSFSYGIPAKSTNWEPFEFVIPETVNGKDPETGKVLFELTHEVGVTFVAALFRYRTDGEVGF